MSGPARDPRSIRPGLWVFGALFLGVAALGVASVVTRSSPLAARDRDGAGDDRGGRQLVLEPADDESDPDDHGTSRALDDPGARGSAREAWARFSAERREPLPPLVEAVVDPQLSRFHALYAEDSPPPFAPLARRGRVLSAQGLDLDSAEPCEVRVLPVDDSSFNCLVRVMCGRTVVYPNRAQTAGYMSCELGEGGPTEAADQLPSVTDGDPAVSFDLARGTVTVRDADRDGRTLFDVTLSLDPGALPVM